MQDQILGEINETLQGILKELQKMNEPQHEEPPKQKKPKTKGNESTMVFFNGDM